MSQQDIIRLENEINIEKYTLLNLEREKSQIQLQFNSKQSDLLTASQRAVGLPSSAPIQLLLLRQAVEIEASFTQAKSQIDNQIASVKRKIEMKERQLTDKRNQREENRWSTTFK